MKRILIISFLFIIPAFVVAQSQAKDDNQNNVKLSKADNKKTPEKSGRLDNAAIRKSKKKMAKQSAEFDAAKYDSRVNHGSPVGSDKGKKTNKPDKKQQKKGL